VQKIELNRGKQYNHPNLDSGNIIENFKNIGIAWGALISSYSGRQTAAIPPHLVSHMMAALKAIRAMVPSAYQQDDYDDMENYVKFAARMDPQNPRGDIDDLC
jgi:hypothetical protein